MISRSKQLGGATVGVEALHKKYEQKHIFSTCSPYEWVSHSLQNTLSLVEHPRPVTWPSAKEKRPLVTLSLIYEQMTKATVAFVVINGWVSKNAMSRGSLRQSGILSNALEQSKCIMDSRLSYQILLPLLTESTSLKFNRMFLRFLAFRMKTVHGAKWLLHSTSKSMASFFNFGTVS